MPAVPFPVTSSPGARPQEGAGRLKNAYAVKTEQGARSPLKWLRSPGLAELVDIIGREKVRGAIEITGGLLVVVNDRVVSITQSGLTYTVTDLGTIPGSDLVTIARNNATPANIVLDCQAGSFNLFPSSPPTDFADADKPASISVSVLDGYFVWAISDGRIFASGLNAVTVATNSFTTAQGRSDGLLRGVAHRGEFFAFGQSSCEVYADRGLSPFPLEFVTMIPRGLAGTYAVAGFEEGWANQLLWVADDDTVCQLSGYTATPVSTEDVSRDIAATPDKSVLEASVYMSSGNAFWVLTRPGFWTWEYNLTTKTWNERESHGISGWRISRTVRAFGKWLAGDRGTGMLFEISATTYKEGDDPLVWEVVSGAVAQPPVRIQAPRLDVDMTAAVGRAAGTDPIETEPRVEVSVSLDGGYSYGAPIIREIGREGEAKKIIGVNRLGLAGSKGFRFKLRVSDPVPATLFGAQVSGLEQRAPG